MFINSIPAIFAYTNLLTPFKFATLLLLVILAITITTPQIKYLRVKQEPKSIYLILYNCWMGEESLWKAFWPFFILINCTFLYIDYRIENLTYTISSWRTVHVMLFIPGTWWLTSVFKCSVNTGKTIWSICAKSLLIYVVIDYFLRLYISYYYPQIIFDCKLLAIEFGTC